MTTPTIEDIEQFRREKASMSRSPLTGELAESIPDYSTSITHVGAAHKILTESIENCQRQRTETAFAVLKGAVDDLGRWLRERDFKV